MKINGPFGRLGLVALTGLAVGAWSTSAHATTKTVNLRAVEYLKCLPKEPAAGQTCTGIGGRQVRMWGFVETNGSGTPLAGAVPSSPGPTIVLGPTDDILRVNLRNGLPADADPYVNNAVSFVVPGLQAVRSTTNALPPLPVSFTDPSGRTRVRSFTTERARGTAATAYWFRVNQPGTYIYHSGTHPQVQVQMGLYGAVIKSVSPGVAYPNTTYDQEAVVVYSEIDEHLHAAIDAGTYMPFGNPATQTTSTIQYTPVYYLVNGKPYDPTGVAPLTPAAFNPLGDQGLDGGFKGGKTLLRVVNAGLKSHVPVINGGAFKIIAEDGKPYAHPRDQVSAHIAAGQTLDLLVEPSAYGKLTVFDRALGLSNANGSAGGLYANFVVHDLVQTTVATYTTNGRRFTIQGTSNHDLAAGAVTMTAWGTYNNGNAPRNMGTLTAQGTSGNWVYSGTYVLPQGVARPNQVRLVSSLGGAHSLAVTVQ